MPSLTASQPVAGTVRIGWTYALADQTGFDLVRGDLVGLGSTGGDFISTTQLCLANDVTAPPVDDAAVPAAGQGFWYLLRAVSCGGAGTYDEVAPPQSGSRDAEIVASGNGCS